LGTTVTVNAPNANVLPGPGAIVAMPGLTAENVAVDVDEPVESIPSVDEVSLRTLPDIPAVGPRQP
jgi:hypothetical protein